MEPLVVEEFETLRGVVLQPLERLTDADFLRLCERYPECRIESTSEGEVIIVPPTNPQTGSRNAWITMQLLMWAERAGGEGFDSSAGFFLPNGARRSPDAAWASRERLEGLRSEADFWHISPNFVIELKSGSDKLSVLRAKMREWVENGVELAWLIVPETRTVEVYRAATETVEVLERVDEVRGDGPVEGFVLRLEKVWAGLR